MSIEWRKFRAKSKIRRARCKECGNRTFVLRVEPVARQAKKLKAHHIRTVAKCAFCRREGRIALGPPK
jgi:uncharacterized protein with PIN domain